MIPISAQLKYNIEVVCEYITKNIPIPLRDFTSEPRLIGELEGEGRGGTHSGSCWWSLWPSLEPVGHHSLANNHHFYNIIMYFLVSI